MTAFIIQRVTSIAFILPFPFASPTELTASAEPQHSTEQGRIIGLVKEATTDAAVAGAKVILSCDCPAGRLEAETNARGIYSFSALPAGAYLVRVRVGDSSAEDTVELAAGATVRSNFSIDLIDAETLQVVAPPTNYAEDGCGHCSADDTLSGWGLLLFVSLLGANTTLRRRRSPVRRSIEPLPPSPDRGRDPDRE